MLLALITLCATVCNAADRQLNLFIWSEYIDPAVVADFEKERDCKVVIDLFEDPDSMLAKVQSGGSALYDVVVPPDHMVDLMIKKKLLAEVPRTKLTNFAHLDERFLNAPFDPSNRFSVPYQWGTVGLYLRPPAGKNVEATWGILFDPKAEIGPFLLIDSMRDTIGAALKYKGHSLNSTNPAELKEAMQLIIAAKKRARGLEASVAGKNKVLAKQAAAALIYSGEGARGMSEDAATRYLIPKEGSQIWLDNLVVLAKAPHAELAWQFIDHVLKPTNSARIANFTQFCTPNKSALSLVSKELRENPSIYPPAEIMPKLEFLKDLGPASRLYDEVWTRIKAE